MGKVASVFAGKNIVVGVTGSIAAFKVAAWVSDLAKEEACVSVVMTDAAKQFIAPLTFQALSGREVHTDMFDDVHSTGMSHIEIGSEADLFIVAPATANTIAKLANGIADNLLTATLLAARCDVLVFPAMNTKMYAHGTTQSNLRKLHNSGYIVIDPESGMMACKETGKGRLVEWENAREWIAKGLSKQDLKGEKIVVTAGPTREPLDPARFLSNRSSGKMGYALARLAMRRGAEVILISGPSSLECPPGVRRITAETAIEMEKTVLAEAAASTIIIKAAAVADFRPESSAQHKVKKEDAVTSISLARNPDILQQLGENKPKGQILVGFAAESRNLLEEGRKKLRKKRLDLIAINDIRSAQSGFEVDTNQVVLLDSKGDETLPLTTKSHTADLILDRIVQLREEEK